MRINNNKIIEWPSTLSPKLKIFSGRQANTGNKEYPEFKNN